MELLNRRRFLELAGTTAAGTALLPNLAFAAPNEAMVFTADAQSALVDSVIIVGDESAMLIDAQFTAPSAAAVADMIEATGKRLDTILISHYHPDHILGLAVIMDRFPDAKPVAHAKVQPGIEATAAGMLQGMSANAPAGVFADRVVIPEVLFGDTIDFEGERISVLDPIHGDTEFISPVYIESLSTLVAADLVYADTHAWVEGNQTQEDIAKWQASLDQLEAIGATTVIPGHRLPSTVNDATTIAKTRAYLTQWSKAKEETSNAEDLRAAMMAGNEDLGLTMALDRALEAAYPG